MLLEKPSLTIWAGEKEDEKALKALQAIFSTASAKFVRESEKIEQLRFSEAKTARYD